MSIDRARGCFFWTVAAFFVVYVLWLTWHLLSAVLTRLIG